MFTHKNTSAIFQIPCISTLQYYSRSFGSIWSMSLDRQCVFQSPLEGALLEEAISTTWAFEILLLLILTLLCEVRSKYGGQSLLHLNLLMSDMAFFQMGHRKSKCSLVDFGWIPMFRHFSVFIIVGLLDGARFPQSISMWEKHFVCRDELWSSLDETHTSDPSAGEISI